MTEQGPERMYGNNHPKSGRPIEDLATEVARLRARVATLERAMEHVPALLESLQNAVEMEDGEPTRFNLQIPLLEADPTRPPSGARMYVLRVAGKDTVKAYFRSGASQTVATEP